MGKGGQRRCLIAGYSVVLCLMLLAWANAAASTGLVVRALEDDPPAAEVLSGRHDARLGPPVVDAAIRQPLRAVQWWRVESTVAIPADGAPKLVLRAPFIYQVQAWRPGAQTPTRHALYGADADDRYSHRALVVDLPQGLAAGAPVWLRVERGSAAVMTVGVESLDQVHREDLAYLGWRVMVLSSLSVLVVLALAFWAGTGERSYGYFAGMLVCTIAYLAALDGDLRWLPGAELVFGTTPQTNRTIGSLGIMFSNLFQRAYLDLRSKLPLCDRLLSIAALAAAGCAVLSVLGDWLLMLWVANLTLLFSALVQMLASVLLSVRGDRAGRVVLASWLALMVFSSLMGAQMLGLWVGWSWLGKGLSGSFVLASLLLALGLSDKLLQLRRDRDHASLQASIDPVTKALNRHGIGAQLEQAVEEARRNGTPLSIAFVDLDYFKDINDRHGHGVGDQCLRIVSWRLNNQLRSGEPLGRYGGDEFLVVLPGCRRQEALSIAERMRVSVDCRPLTMAGASIRATLSIGVAELDAEESLESLIERADSALYASKSAGRNRASAAGSPQELWAI